MSPTWTLCTRIPQAAKDSKKKTKELIQSTEDQQWDEDYGLNTFQHSQPALNMLGVTWMAPQCYPQRNQLQVW